MADFDFATVDLTGSLVEAFDRERLWHFRAAVWRVIDGDTFVALTDGGFKGAAMPHIRIAGYNAPEMSAPGGHAAKTLLARTIPTFGSYADGQWPLRIVSHQRETVVREIQTFERYVADVYIIDREGRLQSVRGILVGP